MAPKKYPLQFEQNDKLFKALIENSWDVIILVDKRGRAIYASPSIVRMFGRDYSEFIGVKGIKFIHPLDAPKVAKALGQIILNPHKPVHMEMRVRHKLGHYLWVESLATNFLSDKNINGIVVNLHNITTLKEIEERKDEFISIASHELKSPITSLHVYLQLLHNSKEKLSLTKLEDFLNKMEYQTKRLDLLVNDLYDAARIREGKMPLRKETFRLLPMLKETTEEIERNYGTHRIVFYTKFNGTVVADRMRMQQVITNLLTNGIKFSPKANKIKVSIWKKGNNIYISITDYGMGISKEYIEKITDRFFQADTTNKNVPGLGLGLYIAYNIIRQHGGEFSVKSKLGKSTTVTVSFPKK